MKFLVRIIIVLSLFFTNYSLANSLNLKDIRVGGKKLTTRIVLDFDKPTEYKIFTLNNPYRIVIDTNQFNTKLEPHINPKTRTAVRSIRHGVFRPNVSRTVLVLRYPVRIKKIQMLKGSKPRFVLDIVKTSSSKHVKQKPYQSKGWGRIDIISKKKQKAQFEASSKPTKKGGKPLIIIDAGHGGVDSGSTGIGGVYEKYITLKVAKAIRIQLLRTGKFNVHLTRSRDFYIPLRTRYKIAEKKQADFFISIHADSHRRRSVRGMSVYTLSAKSSDREAARLARKESLFDEMIGDDTPSKNHIQNILIDIVQSGTMNASAIFAKSLVKNTKRDRITLLRRPHRSAGFAVLKSPHIPSVLIESGYMSNKYDIRNLTSSKWHNKLAKSISKSLLNYFKNHPIR